MITVCWLLGSVLGIRIARQVKVELNGFILLGILAYFTCGALLTAAPFNSQLWSLYAIFVLLIGLYPGVFFARLSQFYTARQLFFRENNGFIIGLVSGTLLFLVLGRAVLWVLPLFAAALVMFCTTLFSNRVRLNTLQETMIYSAKDENLLLKP